MDAWLPSGGQGELSIADLMKGLGDAKTKLGPARKALLKMAKQAEPLTAPLPGPVRERQERKAGYATTKEDIIKWQPLVKVCVWSKCGYARADMSVTCCQSAVSAGYAPRLTTSLSGICSGTDC